MEVFRRRQKRDANFVARTASGIAATRILGLPVSLVGLDSAVNAFAADLEKQGAASLRIAGGYATQSLALPVHLGNDNAEAPITKVS